MSVLGLGSAPEYPIPTRNTCDGADVSLPMKWSNVPSGTAELAVIIINLKPVNESFFFDWAVAGISPTSHGISAGTLPSGAVVGRNSFGAVGYSICPPKGTSENYIAKVLALPRRIATQPGFDPLKFYMEANRSVEIDGLSGSGSYSRP